MKYLREHPNYVLIAGLSILVVIVLLLVNP